MRVGVSSSGRGWVSMGPLGLLLFLAFVLPVMAAWYTARLLGWLCVLIYQAAAAYRAARRAAGGVPV